jgi:diacylglycerol kinase (ATP)
MDIGRVTFGDDRVIYLFNLLGWGLAADATATAEECRCLGTLRYDFGAVWQIILGSKRSVRMDIDGEVYEGDYCLVLVQNNQHGGSRLRFAPFAKMDDGCLDVVIARNDGRMATISLFDEVKRDGCHVYEESVVYRRFKRMTLSTPQPTLVNIDGEGGFVTPLTVECVPSAISMYAAPLRL